MENVFKKMTEKSEFIKPSDPVNRSLFLTSFLFKNDNNLKIRKELLTDQVAGISFLKDNEVSIGFNLNYDYTSDYQFNTEKDLFNLPICNIEIKQYTKVNQVFKVITLKKCEIKSKEDFLYDLHIDDLGLGLFNDPLDIVFKYKDYEIVYTEVD